MARKPMREKLIAQYDVAVIKAAIRAAERRSKSSQARSPIPRAVKVPKMADQSLRAGIL